MDLPIDARDAPFKAKYIDEETRLLTRWIQFGTDIIDGTCQITDPQGSDVIIGVTKHQADALVQARTEFVNRVVHILNQTPSATYGPERYNEWPIEKASDA